MKRPFHRRLLRDKRPCGMPFNSRTDIRWTDQGSMEIFDKTSRKKEQVPMPSNVIEGILRKVDVKTILINGKFLSAS